jgi:hypothetical protein
VLLVVTEHRVPVLEVRHLEHRDQQRERHPGARPQAPERHEQHEAREERHAEQRQRLPLDASGGREMVGHREQA